MGSVTSQQPSCAARSPHSYSTTLLPWAFAAEKVITGVGRATTTPNVITVSVGEEKGHRAGILSTPLQVQDVAHYSSKYR